MSKIRGLPADLASIFEDLMKIGSGDGDRSSEDEMSNQRSSDGEADEHLGTIVDKDGRPYIVTGYGDSGFYQLTIRSNQRRGGGSVNLTWDTSVMRLADITLEEDTRNKGVGTQVLHIVIEIARKHHLTEITGFVNHDDAEITPYLLEWYEKNGFTVELRPTDASSRALIHRFVD